jgi:hypothetical protein
MRMNHQIVVSTLLIALFVLVGLSQSKTAKPTPPAYNSSSAAHAVVVELFTSEGCSSCPPADLILKKLSEQPTTPGAEIIALEEHVDYWDHQGWKDPYSNAEYTERQNEYAQVLRKGGIYTPQMIVDGQTEFIGGHASEAMTVIQKASAQPKFDVQLSPSTNTDNNKATFDIRVSNLAALPEVKDSELWVAITEKNLYSDVKAGENSGERLEHAPVVRKIQRVDSFRSPGDHQAHAAIKLEGFWQRQNLAFVAFTTDKRTHKITGAATSKVM